MPLLTPPIKNIKITDAKPSANELARFAEVRRKSTISQVTEPLKEEILKGDVRTIEDMKAWLQAFGYSDAIKDATNNAILREFVMSKVSCESLIDAPTGAKRIRNGYLPCDASWHQQTRYL